MFQPYIELGHSWDIYWKELGESWEKGIPTQVEKRVSLKMKGINARPSGDVGPLQSLEDFLSHPSNPKPLYLYILLYGTKTTDTR